MSVSWWTGGQGWSGVAQWPNPAILVWFIALVMRWSGLFSEQRTVAIGYVGRGALIVWAADELVRGTNPLRRVMGAVVLGYCLVRLFA